MTRALIHETFFDEEGRPLSGVDVRIKQKSTDPASAADILATIYAVDDDAGSATLTQPLETDEHGRVIAYLENPDRVDLYVTAPGRQPYTRRVDAMKLSSLALSVQDEGVGVPTRNTWNFVGGGVTVTDDPVNGKTVVTIPTGGVTDHGALTGLGDDDHPQYIKDSEFDAAGDLLKGTGADTFARMARGTALQLLRVNAAGNDLEWGGLGDLLDWQYVRKTANEVVSGSTTLQNDDHLSMALAANTTWEFEVYLHTNSPSDAQDIKVAFTGPAGVTIRWGGIGLGTTASSSPGVAHFPSDIAGGSNAFGVTSSWNVILLKGIVQLGGTAGTFQLQWAQNNAASSTELRDFSYMICRRVV